MSVITLNLDGLTFGGTDTYGTEWTVATEDGWYAAPPRRIRSAARPSQDGLFPARSLSGARTYTITGLAKASSNVALIQSAQAFAAAANDGDQYAATWNDPTGEYWALVERDDSKFEILTDSKARYSLTVLASDPRKYGSPQIQSCGPYVSGVSGLVYPLVYPLTYGTIGSGGSVTFTNYGTAPTEPLITVSSPVDYFTVTYVQAGKDLSYYNPASALRLDSYQGRATENGEDRTRWLLSRQWFQVQPGQTATFSISTVFGGPWTVNPLMTVSMAPAYW